MGKVRLVPKAEAHQIQSAQFVPSLEVLAGSLVLASVGSSATRVQVDIDLNRFEIRVQDNGATVRNDVWPLLGVALIPHVRAQVVHSAAALSVVNITSASINGVQRKGIRYGREVQPSPLPSQSVSPVSLGVTIHVAELFANYPVRRRQLRATSPEVILRAIHRRILEIALINCSTRITLSVSGTVHLRSSGKPLSPKVLNTLLPPARPNWKHVYAQNTEEAATISGYVAPYTLSRRNDEFQLVAINGVPLIANARVHNLITQSTREFLRDRGDAPMHHAYVLKVTCDKQLILVSSYEAGATVVGYRRFDVEKFITKSILNVVQSSENIPSSAASVPIRDVRDDFRDFCEKRKKIDSSVRKRERSPLPQITANLAKIHRTLKRPVSGGSPAKRPLSAIERRGKKTSDVRPHSGYKIVKRPRSAQDVQSAVLKSVPEWHNLSLQFSGRAPSSLVRPRSNSDVYMNGGKALDMKRVRIGKYELENMHLVGRVDSKFIILVDQNDVLYALDQHAASERVHFERLLRQVRTGAPSRRLNRLVEVPLSYSQHSTLCTRRCDVERWGWSVDGIRSKPRPTVRMVAVPTVEETDIVLDNARCLLRFLDALVGGAPAVITPKPLVQAIATYACHSAVRFGDTLNDVQCVKLLEHLARCDHPFACAHGRPSIVPLVQL